VSAGGPYSDRVRLLFADPPHAGVLPPGPGRSLLAGALALERGAWLEVAARVVEGVVVDARFRAWGCPHFIAACELAVAALPGRPLGEAGRVEAAALARELAVPAGKLGRLLVIEDALRDLAATPAQSK
jgi:NifU-like protein involved in Fe-S cluster formation